MSASRPVRPGWPWLLLLGAALSGCGWVDGGVDKNKPPVPVDDLFISAEGGTLEVSANNGVLANDTDGGSAPLKATLVTEPARAAAFEFNSDGSFRYVHDGSESTEDGFTYTASDGIKTSIPKTVKITITPVNDPPFITGQNEDPLITPEDAPIDVRAHLRVADPDNTYPEDFTLSLASGPNYSVTGSTVTPAADYNGPIGVEVTVNDGRLDSDPFSLTIEVAPVNDAPIISGQQTIVTPEDTPRPIGFGDLVVSDADTGTDKFQLEILPPPPGADYSVNGTTVQPAPDFHGQLAVPIRVNDGIDASAVFNLALTVAPVNDAPTNISLSASSVAENRPAGTAVGAFSTTDPDTGDTHTYTFATGAGDTDNGAFSIVDNELRTTVPFNYEARNTYSIRVRSTDSGGAAIEKPFTITVADANDAPTHIALSNARVAENRPVGTVVGTLSTADPDAGDTHTYTLVAGAGSEDNASFSIVGNELRTADSFNRETKDSYGVRVRSTDGGGATVEKPFTITVTDANDPPTQIALSATNVAENRPAGTAVGVFSTTDPDTGDSHTYALVSGAGDTDNGAFSIVGDKLRTAAPFDYEAQNSYSIRVRSTDDGTPSASLEKRFTITVTDANDPPTHVALSAASVAENQPEGTAVGAFSTTDPDTGDTHTYALVAGAGDAGNGSFGVVGNELRTAASFDYETRNSYSIRVRSTDNGSPTASLEQQFTITVTDANDAPTAIALSNAGVEENQPASTVVGIFSTADPDTGDTHTYALVAGAGDADNGVFSIAGDKLQTGAPFDYETKDSYSIRVRSADSGGTTVEKPFTITVDNINEAPVITSTPPGADTGNPPNVRITEGDTHVYDVDAIDPDREDKLAYSLNTAPPGMAIHKKSGLITWTPSGTDVRTDPYPVSVRVTDSGEPPMSATQNFTITVDPAVGPVSSKTTTASGCWTTPQEQALTATLPAEATLTPPLTYTLLADATKGAVTLEPTGQFTYIPSLAAPRGRDTFTYTVEGALANTLTRTATVIVNARVMTLGDSVTTGITDGETDPANPTPSPAQRGGYRKPLYDALAAAGYGVDLVGTQSYGAGLTAFDADNEGHEGWSASELASGTTTDSGIYHRLTQHPADVVLLHVGTDVLTPLTDGVAAILDAIDRWEGDTGHTVTVILARIIDHNPPDASGDVTTFNNNLQALAEARIASGDSLVIVDQQSSLWDADNLPNPAFYGDTLHPNSTGYAKMGNVWFGALSPRLDKCP